MLIVKFQPMATKKSSETKKSTQTKKSTESKKRSTTSSRSKSGKSSASSSRASSKKNNPWLILLGIVVVILAIAWFLGGKPRVEFGVEGKIINLVQTEEPLINRPHDIIPSLLGEETSESQSQSTETSDASSSTSESGNQSSESTVTSSGDGASSSESTASTSESSSQTSGDGTQTSESTVTSSQTSASASALSSTGTKGSSSADLGYSENDPLFFGNPTDAFGEVSYDENYLMIKPQFTLSYNTKTMCPNWVAWHLDSDDIGDADRSDDFLPDSELPEDWYGIKKSDYQYNSYGFDRGHVCPSADRTATKEDNSMTFLMTNMVPQSPDNNRVIWMHFENYERSLVAEGNEVYIIAGPYGSGGTGAKGTFDSIPVKTKSGEVLNMNVPAYTWKVLIALPEGEGDIDRIDENTKTIAINVPNKMGMGKTGDWEQFLCSIDDIETLTGYDFFELLPDDIEDKLESKIYEYVK